MATRKSTLQSTLRDVNTAQNAVSTARRKVQTQLSKDLLAYIRLEDQLGQMTRELEYAIISLNADQQANIAPLPDLLARTRRDILRKRDEARSIKQRPITLEEQAISRAYLEGYVFNGFLSTKGVDKFNQLRNQQTVRTTEDEALYLYLRSF